MQIPFDNQYVTLGERFYVKTNPTSVVRPTLIKFNELLANNLGFSGEEIASADVAAIFAGNHIPDGALCHNPIG